MIPPPPVSTSRRTDFDGYLYLMPALGIILFFHVFPILLALYIAFFKWNLIAPAKFVGVANFRQLLFDPMFYASIKNTAIFAFCSVPLAIALALFFATLLNNQIAGLGVYRTLFFLPVITSMNAVAMVWHWIFHDKYGILNYFLGLFHLGPFRWLDDPMLAMPSIILMSIWKGLGHNIVLFLAGLQNIPGHLYEAAELDGATPWQKFRHITFPLLSPVTFFITVTSVISAFSVFAQIYIMTPTGGPMGSTTTLVFYLYQVAFNRFRFGYASALAFAIFLILMALTAFQKFYLEKRVHYR